MKQIRDEVCQRDEEHAASVTCLGKFDGGICCVWKWRYAVDGGRLRL